jgi:DNA mismatch repair protein MutH
MAQKLKEIQAVRLTAKLLEQAQKLAKKENRKLSAMLRILIEEALERRNGAFGNSLEREIAANVGREAEGLR